MIPKSHHEYWILASLNAIWNFWMLQHVPKDYCQRHEDLPLDFFSKPWRSASVLTAFWAMSSWLCVVRHGAADGPPNSPKWHRWKLPNWALSSLHATCLLPLWEMYSKPGYFMISRNHGATQPRYLDFCQETIQEMVFHDCSPSLHPLIRCMESSLIQWETSPSIIETKWGHSQSKKCIEMTCCIACSLFDTVGTFGRRSNGFSGLCKARESTAWRRNKKGTRQQAHMAPYGSKLVDMRRHVSAVSVFA